MKELKILSWNINGIRSARDKGLLEWLYRESPDILCLQETKAHPEQLSADLLQPQGYSTYWSYPERKGYSGVAIFTRQVPIDARHDWSGTAIDMEGRILIVEYADFTLLNIYFPNGKQNEARLKYKLDFYDAFFEYADRLKAAGKKLVICGDVNTAHKEIDLARPKENAGFSGFLPIEREWMDKFVSHGYIDTFRHFNKEPHQYTWWDLKSRARERNVGWRIDYFFVTGNLLPSVSNAFIMPQVMGSDHCPIGITIKMD
ncbi:MAG: exodeoxyribonuclease III [Dehalococcoidia bacterium]